MDIRTQAPTGTSADALIAGPAWAGTPGETTVITYSFAASPQALPPQDQAVVRKALASIAAVCNVRFAEVADDGVSQGTLRYAYSPVPNAMGQTGYAFYPSPDALGGDILLGAAQAGREWAYMRPSLVLHETLHALGLKHPFEGAVTLPVADDIIPNTVMSYSATVGSDGGAFALPPYEPMPLDVLALQVLYGASSANAGDTVYRLGDASFQCFRALWDAGGNDTLDASGCAQGVRLDLTPGARSDIGARVQAFGYLQGQVMDQVTYADTLAIVQGCTIENAIGSAFDDVFKAAGGRTFIDGGAGVDTAVFRGSTADYLVSLSGVTTTVVLRSDAASVTTLRGVERLEFTVASLPQEPVHTPAPAVPPADAPDIQLILGSVDYGGSGA